MSVVKLQRRLLGGANRIDWRADDWARLARHFNYEGPINPLLLKRQTAQVVVAIPEAERSTEASTQVYTWTISTGATDHMLDQIAVTGWDLSIFNANPIVQYAHNADALPVGRSIWAGIEGGRLKSKMVFASDSFAQRVRKMIDERVMRAASVGFKPGEWEFAKDPKRQGGINFTRGHQLLEWSICNVPANPQCLFERADDAKSAEAVIAEAARSTPRMDAARATVEANARRIAEIRGRR